MADIVMLIEQNPILLWGGIVLAALIFLVARHIERMRQRDDELEAPRPSSLDEIVRPKVLQHLDDRGTTPETDFLLKIGREHKGSVYQYLDTEMDAELINPNPRKGDASGSNDSKELPVDADGDGDMVDVRIIRVKPNNFINSIKQFIMSMLAYEPNPENVSDKLYVFRQSSFLDVPGDDMVVDPEALSYQLAGMEIEVSPSTRNVVNQAVQAEVSEKVLAALPNYTEKVDFLFPLHSQSMKEIQQQGEHLREDEGF